MKKDYTNILLGYRDYNQEEKYGKDFLTIDSVVEWLCEQTLRYAETTKEFYDFAEQEYGIEAIISRMFDENADFEYGLPTSKEEIRLIFENRNNCMHALDFKDTAIPQR